MKYLIPALALFLFACGNSAQKTEEHDGMHITVSDSNGKAEVDMDSTGIHVNADDGKEADVHISPNGINVKTAEGEEATMSVNKEGMDIKTKDGNTSVNMDKHGNMKVKGPDGKEIEVKVSDPDHK